MNLYKIIPSWQAPKHIKAFTTLAFGGFSQGIYANSPYTSGLNPALHVGDNIKNVQQNRNLIANNIQKDIIWLEQTHSIDIVDIDKDYTSNIADASFSTNTQKACAIMTADCLPLLITDTKGIGILAIHAGWKGLANGIIEKSIEYFIQNTKVNPDNILVWLGPAISPLAFEVGIEVKEIFLDKALVIEKEITNNAFVKNNNKNCADLYGLARIRIARCGIKSQNISGGEFCTYFDTRFYSYRRNKVTGRMASIIYKT